MKKNYSIIGASLSWLVFNIGSFFIFENFLLGVILISASLVSFIWILKLYRSPKDKTNQVFWYISPFALGLLGGLVGFFCMRKRNPQLAENIIITGLLSLVVSALTYFLLARILIA